MNVFQWLKIFYHERNHTSQNLSPLVDNLQLTERSVFIVEIRFPCNKRRENFCLLGTDLYAVDSQPIVGHNSKELYPYVCGKRTVHLETHVCV